MSVHNAAHGAKCDTPNEGMRHRRRAGYYVPRATIRDESISYVALGLLAYLLDRPRGWRVRGETLAALRRDSEKDVMSGLAELRAKGYYRLERRRLLSGRFAMGTAISEEPVAEWAADNAEYAGKAVPLEQQPDGSFLVRHKNGELTDDGIGEVDDVEPDPPVPSSPDPRNPGTGEPGPGQPDPGIPGSLRREEEKNHREEKLLVPAVGELQHRKGDPSPDLRPESEEPALDLTDPGPATAPPSEPAPSQSPIWAILSAIPEQVRSRITPSQQPELVNAIRAELADQSRTLAELLDRVGRRWSWWEHTGERVGCPVAVAKTLIQRRHCSDLRCEDGVSLDSGRPCMACADSRPLKSQPAEPIPPPAPAAPVGPAPSSRPDSRSVAEALAPVPYVPDGETQPVRPSRSPSGPNAAVAELRAAWASKGVHSPRQRREAVSAARPTAVDENLDSPVKAARAYLGGRGDFDVWVTRAQLQLGMDAPRDDVFLLAAQLAKAS